MESPIFMLSKYGIMSKIWDNSYNSPGDIKLFFEGIWDNSYNSPGDKLFFEGTYL